MQLVHVAFYVRDLDRSMAFYRILGFEYAYDLKKDDGSVWLVYLYNGNHQFIELFPEEGGDREPLRGSFFHFCLTVQDIAACAKRLKENGITLYRGAPFRGNVIEDAYVPEPMACGSYAFFLKDPDGNSIEVMQYTENSLQARY